MAMHLYDGYVGALAERFKSALSEIQAHFKFEYGSEFEIAICKTLRRALPNKYGVCRGFVVNAEGELAGDDIILYDRARFPTLRALGEEDSYAQKERIPIEAVYAYIEAKHTIELEGDGRSSLHHTWTQVAKVKTLCSKREGVPASQIRPYLNFNIDGIFKIDFPPEYPKTQNPIYTMILARNVRVKPNTDFLTDVEEICRRLTGFSMNGFSHPDALILGESIVVLPVIPDQTSSTPRLVSPFFLEGVSNLQHNICPENAFGLALCLLLFALDWIQLGNMPWQRIVFDAFERK